MLHHAVLSALPPPVPVLSTVPWGHKAGVNYQVHFEGGTDHLSFGNTSQERDRMAGVALERARTTWGPLLAGLPWLRPAVTLSLSMGLVCGPDGPPLNPTGLELLRWARTASGDHVGAEGWQNGISSGGWEQDWRRVAACIRLLRATGEVREDYAWPTWSEYSSLPPKESYVEPWVREGLLGRAHLAGQRSITSFLPIALSSSLDTAREPPAYIIPQNTGTGADPRAPGPHLGLMTWDRWGLAPFLGWVRDDYQLEYEAADLRTLREGLGPLVAQDVVWLADMAAHSDWLGARDRVDLHGYARNASGLRVPLTLTGPSEGATVQLLGLGAAGILGVEVDGGTARIVGDRVVLGALPAGEHTLRVALAPGVPADPLG